MDESSPVPLGDNWMGRLPFSQRQQLRNEAHDQVPAEENASSTPWPPIAALSEPEPECESDPITVPIVTQSAHITHDLTPFRVLTPAEVTPEERRQIEIQMTALYWTQKLLNTDDYIEPPESYRARNHVLKLVLDLLIPSGVVMLTLIFMAISAFTGLIQGGGWLVMIVVFLAITLISAYPGYRAFWSWQHLYWFSTTTSLGRHRPENKWLFLKLINDSVPAQDYTTGEVDRSQLFMWLRLNSWVVTLDTNAQEDKFLHDIHFILDGERLKNTAEANKNYTLQIKNR